MFQKNKGNPSFVTIISLSVTPHGAHSNRNPSEASSVFVCSKNGLPRAQKSVSAPQTLQAGLATSLLHDTPMVGAEQCRLYGKCGLSPPFPPSSSFTFLLSLNWTNAYFYFLTFVQLTKLLLLLFYFLLNRVITTGSSYLPYRYGR